MDGCGFAGGRQRDRQADRQDPRRDWVKKMERGSDGMMECREAGRFAEVEKERDCS